MATAARRCTSRFVAAGVTRRYDVLRRGRNSCSRPTRPVIALPAAPDVRFEAGRRQAAFAVWVGQGRQPRLPDQVGLGRPDRRDVELVAPDDGDPDPDRAVVLGPVEAQALALVAEPLVRRTDRLL